ncbi:isoprenoid synthase domain-containing protein [Dunaliella salina]|uniref:Isoprenoid synthase domain-containing protein n=1 Tax=Dunaliella salina TaxID=3046 RepID=A0ABQ7GKX9_DUNSA|nr:isoprenoid synthase domain-containing protein [Dunaliella salina]|eukprot:KAF5835267.1 isoprenoid synthase domain-containing protein [Dunaliella salina]
MQLSRLQAGERMAASSTASTSSRPLLHCQTPSASRFKHSCRHRPAEQLSFPTTALPSSSSSTSTSNITTRVITPSRAESLAVPSQEELPPPTPTSTYNKVKGNEGLLASIVAPAQADVEILNVNLKNVVGDRHPMLMAAAEQIFGAGGKKLRPLIVFLVARATASLMNMSDINDRQRRLAEITEMIHTASLVHDDVLDDCDTRRGQTTVNSMYGTRVAVLAGDFLFAQSSWFLANLDNLEVIKLISQVIADFANGEISQAASLFDTETTLESYMDKSFYKTASLIAASCRSASVFSEVPLEVKEAMYGYGKHLGLAFQVVDDVLDFTQTAEQLGKPQGQDLASGNLTAPVIYALQNPAVKDELLQIIESEFVEEGSVARALQLVEAGGGIEAARGLARQQGDLALKSLDCLTDSPSKRSLQLMVDYVLDRIF